MAIEGLDCSDFGGGGGAANSEKPVPLQIETCTEIKFINPNSVLISRTNVASVGSVFNDTRKVKVLSLPETIKEKLTFRAKAPLLTPDSVLPILYKSL